MGHGTGGQLEGPTRCGALEQSGGSLAFMLIKYGQLLLSTGLLRLSDLAAILTMALEAAISDFRPPKILAQLPRASSLQQPRRG